MKNFVIVVGVLLVSLTANADTWTLDSCISYAIEHNLTVKAREIDKSSGELSVTEAKSGFLPKVSADAGETFSFGRGLTAENVYANRNTTNFQWGANASVPLFQGLSNIRKLRAAKTSLRGLIHKLDAAKDDVTLNIISQYLQVLYCDEVMKTAVEQVELSRNQLERQKALAEDGKIAEVEVMQATSQLAQDKLTLSDAENGYRMALVDLAQLMQLDDINGLEVSPLPDSSPVIPTAESVYASASVHNNAVKAANVDVLAAADRIKVAQSGYLPSLSFNAGTGSSYYTISGIKNPSFSSQMRDNFNTYLGFSLSVPIFDGFSTRNSVRRAKIDKLTAELQREETRSNLYKTIQQAYYQAIGAQNKYNASLTAEEAMKLSFGAMKEKYEMGRANSTEFEQSKTDYFKATVQRIQARYEYILRHKILMFYAHMD